MAQVFVTPQAQRDVDVAISTPSLPADSWARIVHSLRTLETFPLAGHELLVQPEGVACLAEEALFRDESSGPLGRS